MRIAVIGLGRMGRFYTETLAALAPRVELAAVADPSAAARATSAANVSAYADFEAVLERRDIDAVVVASTTSSHPAVVMAAAEAGKAIFCEKPLALTVDDTRRALATVERNKALLQIGFMRRFDASHARARELIQAGAIGTPLAYRSIGRDPGCPPPGYANPALSGGLIIDMGIHDFDQAHWLMSSKVERVSAEGTQLVCEELGQVGDYDNAIVSLRFASGALGSIEVSRTAKYGYDIRAEILGSEGAVRLGDTPIGRDGVALLQPDSRIDDGTPPFIRRFAAAYRAQIEDFVECVLHDRTPRAGGAEALAAIEVAEAATRAARTGTPVEMEYA
jgi:scyllo-inositol 2-dehydrogenase (NAD+)